MANLKNTTINDTGFLRLPSGTTAQRPGSPVSGMIRYNTSLNNSEYYNGIRWIDVSSGLESGVVSSNLVMFLDASNTLSAPGTGSTWRDLSGRNLHASGTSAITGGALNDTQPFYTETTSILDNDNHSIFFMIQINGTNGAWSKVFGYTPSGSDRSPGVWRQPSNRIFHWRYDPSNTGVDFGTSMNSGDLAINTWYYIGVTKSGSTLSCYTNGSLLGTGTVSNPKTTGRSTIQIYPAYNQNTSKMALIQIYDRAISESEVQQNFNAFRGRYGL